MGLLDMLFREKGDSLSLSGYSLTGNTRGGAKWGFAHHDKRAIEIATVRKVKVIAAAAYTLALEDTGTLFIVDFAGTTTITLPAASAAFKGVWAEFFTKQDETLTVVGATADQIIAHNDAAADSVSLATTTEQIGSGIRAICTGTDWLVHFIPAAETVTPTIAT